jgi:AraC-type DNA-binding domain-containing proteins
MYDNLPELLNDKPFPIEIEEHYQDTHRRIFEKHLHNNLLQFFYFPSVRAVIYCGRDHYSVISEDVFLINNNEYHYSERYCNSTDCVVFNFNLNYLDFYGPMACSEKYITPVKQNFVLFNNKIENNNIRQALKDMIVENKAKKNGYEFRMLSLMYNIFFELFESQIAKCLTERNAELFGKTYTRFQNVLEYIESNYESKMTLPQIAEIAEMSKGYFCTKFKQMTGKNFTDYLNQLRIEKAVMLLTQEDLSITDIALAVGFEDVNYFCRVFKKYMKQSPSSFKYGGHSA